MVQAFRPNQKKQLSDILCVFGSPEAWVGWIWGLVGATHVSGWASQPQGLSAALPVATGDLLIAATLKMANYPAISQPGKLPSNQPVLIIEADQTITI